MRASRSGVTSLVVVFVCVPALLASCGDDDDGDDDDDVPMLYSVGGTVSGLEGQLVLQNNGADDLVVTSAGGFTFTTQLVDGAAYAVTIADEQPPQACTIANASGTIMGVDVVDVLVTCDPTPVIERVSVDSAGAEAVNSVPEGSLWAVISGNGRYVAFVSYATNLVADDTNEAPDIFVHDRQTDETTRVSVATDGSQANGSSYLPSISADGRYVAFQSMASNLIAGDTNATRDVFLHDRQTGETSCVSCNDAGEVGDADSIEASVSADGRYVAFTSAASNLVSGAGGSNSDILVLDREAGELSLASVGTGGARASSYSQEPSISADGRYVSFSSDATNLVEGDTNGSIDVFVRDRTLGETVRVSLTDDDAQGNGQSDNLSISGDGQRVVFMSYATNLVADDGNDFEDVFVRDLASGETRRVNVDSAGAEADEAAYPEASISSDGRYVVFASWATNLVAGDDNGDTDIFVHDLQTGETRRLSVNADGVQGNNDSYDPTISGDGSLVAFTSSADNLVADDTNELEDVFVAPAR